MAWLKVDDKLHDHRKVLRLLRLGEHRPDPAALGLWLLAAAWSADNRTDGWVPMFMLSRWDFAGDDHAQQLVDVGLWEPDQVDGDDGFRFHDWHEYNPSKADQEAAAAQHARTVQLHRDPKLIAAIRERDQDRCRYCGTAVNFSDRRSSTGGTYDHTDPDGPNSLGNVVVACRGCNSHKGHRTPAEAGMTLLRPGSLGPRKLSIANPEQVVSRSGQNTETDTTQPRRGSQPARAGSGRGRDGSGADPDLSADLDTRTGGEP